MTIQFQNFAGPYNTLIWAPNLTIAGQERTLHNYNKGIYFALQFFDHPFIQGFLTNSWYGGRDQYELPRRWRFFLYVSCLFEVFIFPLIFFLTKVAGKRVYYIGFHKVSLSQGSILGQGYIFRFFFSTVSVVHSSAKIKFKI